MTAADTEVTRWQHTVIGQATLLGHRVTQTWAICWCTNGLHGLMDRNDSIYDREDAAVWQGAYPATHKVWQRSVTASTGWQVAP